MHFKKRVYEPLVLEHLKEDRQMLFLMGPRQVGKTTTSLEVSLPFKKHHYLNWDLLDDRELIVKGADAVAEAIKLNTLNDKEPIIVFDELHKYGKWKLFLKGFFDKFAKDVRIIVTGSARLDVFKAGGDSLMGRYFPYRLHPFSIAELVSPAVKCEEISPPKKIKEALFDDLFTYGGFPEPLFKRSKTFYNRSKRTRLQQLFQEDLRDLTRVQELGQIQLLAELLKHQVGQLTSYSELAKKVRVSSETVRRWLETLKSFYYCFTVQPWTKNVSRSLLKEPKVYLWDWSSVPDAGAKVENFVASHLLKAVHFWTDCGWGEYELYYLRDKDKREVDFLVVKDNEPWFMVEVKSSSGSPSKALYHFHEMIGTKHALEVAFDLDYVDKSAFSSEHPIVVPAKTFLSQLV